MVEYALGNTTTKRFTTCCRVTNCFHCEIHHEYSNQNVILPSTYSPIFLKIVEYALVTYKQLIQLQRF